MFCLYRLQETEGQTVEEAIDVDEEEEEDDDEDDEDDDEVLQLYISTKQKNGL